MNTVEALRPHQLVIVRRLRNGPLTEFELSAEIAAHSAYSPDQASEKIGDWLTELRDEGLIWAGTLLNGNSQQIWAAVLTAKGRELVKG